MSRMTLRNKGWLEKWSVKMNHFSCETGAKMNVTLKYQQQNTFFFKYLITIKIPLSWLFQLIVSYEWSCINKHTKTSLNILNQDIVIYICLWCILSSDTYKQPTVKVKIKPFDKISQSQ